MLKIRLFRVGRKNKPYYRVVLTDSRNKNHYKALLGSFNCFNGSFKLDISKIDLWLKQGAHMTDTVSSLYNKAKNHPISN